MVTCNLVWKPEKVICTMLIWRLEEGTCNPVWQPGVVTFYHAWRPSEFTCTRTLTPEDGACNLVWRPGNRAHRPDEVPCKCG